MKGERPWSTPELEAIAEFVAARSGLVFASDVRDSVEAKIRRAMAERSIADAFRYRTLLGSDRGAFDALVSELTIGETYFFRESAQLRYIRSSVLPGLVERARDRPLRAWSAGCASGEEAYTLAILLHEEGLLDRARVIGTDLSLARIEQARQATYSEWSMRGTPAGFSRQYFQRKGNRYLLASPIRSAVTFRQLNLSGRSFPSAASGIWGMDLILCRNVLIYLALEAVAEIARRLIASLSDDGWLFLGASDPPLSGLAECDVVVTGAGVAYRRPRRSATSLIPTRTAAPETPARQPPAAASRPSPALIARRQAPRLAEETRSEEGAALIEAALTARDYPRAVVLAGQALRQNAGDLHLALLYIRALAKQGNFDEAGRACSAALERHRASAELMCLHATLLGAAGHHAQSAEAARRALFLDRSMVMAHLLLGLALLRVDDPPKARLALRNAERLLAPLPPDTVIPGSDGESAARLLDLIRRRLSLVQA